MKNLIIAFVLILAAAATQAQDIPETQVPATVKNSFKAQFKLAEKQKWEKKKDAYEVSFKIDSIKHKAKIDAAGKILRHKVDIKHKDLPAAVQKQIAAKYAGFKAKDPEKVEEGGKITYKVELKKDKEKRDVEFAADGAVISEKKD
jgi:uncharacterized membrane protein YkoI